MYKGLQRDIEKSMAETEGIQRKGLVLAAISKFKQICNHPDQYLGNQEFKPKLSGKFEALQSICETIRDKHEQVLIFTQFKEMCEPLNVFLAEVFGQSGLVLHGGVPVKNAVSWLINSTILIRTHLIWYSLLKLAVSV